MANLAPMQKVAASTPDTNTEMTIATTAVNCAVVAPNTTSANDSRMKAISYAQGTNTVCIWIHNVGEKERQVDVVVRAAAGAGVGAEEAVVVDAVLQVDGLGTNHVAIMINPINQKKAVITASIEHTPLDTHIEDHVLALDQDPGIGADEGVDRDHDHQAHDHPRLAITITGIALYPPDTQGPSTCVILSTLPHQAAMTLHNDPTQTAHGRATIAEGTRIVDLTNPLNPRARVNIPPRLQCRDNMRLVVILAIYQ